MTVTLFFHPGAGEGSWSSEHILRDLREAGYDPVFVEMGKPGWEDALDATDELVLAAGGDGTIAALATRLGYRDVPIALLPTGSGNNIARSLGVHAPLDEIIPRLPRARHGPLRLCRATGPWGERLFIESVGLGAIAEAVKELQEEELDGDEKLLRGRISVISAIEAQEPLDVSIEVDGTRIEGNFLIVEGMNLPMIGPNLRLVPDTALRGDSLSVALLPVHDRNVMVDWIVAGAAGVSPLRHVQGRRITFAGEPQPLRLEDKTRDWDGSMVRLEAEPHRVDVLRPSEIR